MNPLNKKRSREEQKECHEDKNKKPKNEEQKEMKKITTSYEGYQKCKITKLSEISEFSSFISLSPPSSDIRLFETKKLADLYFKENKYNIEDILEYDDTNEDIQKEYLTLAVKELNKENKIENINIIKEKIQKSGIILEQNIYDEEIKNIKDQK